MRLYPIRLRLGCTQKSGSAPDVIPRSGDLTGLSDGVGVCNEICQSNEMGLEQARFSSPNDSFSRASSGFESLSLRSEQRQRNPLSRSSYASALSPTESIESLRCSNQPIADS